MRLFDTYISDDEGFSDFQTYICAALFLKWSRKIKRLDFIQLMQFFQNFITIHATWSLDDIEMLIQEAYVYQSLYGSTIKRSQEKGR